MTLYGNTSRISVDLEGAGISGINLGVQAKVVVFARGDPNAGTVSANSPTRVSGPGELSDTFGSGEPIVDYFRQVAANGVGYDMIWGVVPEQTEVQDEDITGGGDAADHTGGSEIANAPIVEDTSLISVEDDQGNTITVEFRYETNKDGTNTDFTGLTPPTDTIYINPNTGEWVADASDDYNITYEYNDWQTAFDNATDVVEEQEVGVWALGSEALSEISNIASSIDPLRTNQWKMVTAWAMAEPNETNSDEDNGIMAVSDYTDAIDDDATFVAAPGRQEGSTRTVVGAVAGQAASQTIDESIIGNALQGVDPLEQTLNVPDQETLEGEELIPLSNVGSPEIEGNLSTSTSSDWIRSFFARRIGDRLILAARAIAKAVRGRLNNEDTETIVEQRISDEIEDLIADGVLKPNTSDNQRWFVTADQDPNNPRELDVSFGFTPTGVTDIVDIDATIDY